MCRGILGDEAILVKCFGNRVINSHIIHPGIKWGRSSGPSCRFLLLKADLLTRANGAPGSFNLLDWTRTFVLSREHRRNSL